MMVLSWIVAALLAGSLVYCILIVIAARRYLSVPQPQSQDSPPISVLKPMYGDEIGLEENLRSFFEQNYPEFEILFALHASDDSARPVVERLQGEYAGRVSSRIIITGESPIPNAKAHSLETLVARAKYDLLVMSDSDVRARPGLLRQLAREIADERVGLVTCPYRAVAEGGSIWSKLEALGINTEFLAGVLVSRMLEGVRFAVGSAIAIRRNVLEKIGGFAYLREFLAEDFVMGNRTAQLGYEVVLSSYVVEHRIGKEDLAQSLRHRLRWARSTRRSRPVGYLGQLFTYPLPLACLFCALRPDLWPVAAAVLLLRAWAAWATAHEVLHDPLSKRYWWLLPVQDVLGFAIWFGGFMGRKIVWRDRQCILLSDGRLQVNS